MMNIKLTLSFDGTDFHGYQIQENAHTIEAELTNALRKLTKENLKIVGCGRTDSGVHALEYIVNFKTNSKIPLEKLPIAINSNISDAISVKKAEIVPDDFHARYSVDRKTYTYRILNSVTRDPFLERYSYRYGGNLDVSKMEQACKEFVGTHDFSSHKSLGTKTSTDVRTMFECFLTLKDNLIEIEMTADGFLYNMARTIAGTILDVGIGKIKPEEISSILNSKDRTKAGATLAAKGLFMKDTKYKDNV